MATIGFHLLALGGQFLFIFFFIPLWKSRIITATEISPGLTETSDEKW